MLKDSRVDRFEKTNVKRLESSSGAEPLQFCVSMAGCVEGGLVGSVDERVRNAKKSFSKKVPKSNLATRC
jgi:hypothetical protein